MLALDAVVGRETEGHDPRVAQRVADRHDVELDGEAFGQRRWGRKLVGRERLEREPLARQVRRGDDLPRAVGLPGRRHGADRAVAEVASGPDLRAGGALEALIDSQPPALGLLLVAGGVPRLWSGVP